MDNAQKIWDRLVSAGYTPAGAAGLMGNLYAESGLIPTNLQNTCEKKLGYTDVTYTAAVDKGAYTNFADDRAGYGLAQWTYPSRKAALLAFAQAQGASIGDLDMQVGFLLQELQSLFRGVWDKLRTSGSVRETSDAVLLDFERPASVNDAKKLQETKDRRAAYAQEFYDKFTKEGNTLKLLKCILTENDCYKCKQTIKPKGVMVHSTGANNPMLRRYVQPIASMPDRAALLAQLGTNKNANHWNRSGTNACVHGFIGKLDDGSVAAVQALPWDHRGWHAGNGTSGRSANDTHISFEICEDGLTDPAYFKQVYQTAVELTAMLCKQYGLDPLADGVVICHQEGYRRGVASNHGDVLHWFPKHGKSMNDFRRDVAAEMSNATPTASETPENAQSFDQTRAGTYLVTLAPGLNIRAGAGANKPLLGVAPEGAAVTCQGCYSTAGGADWLLVSWGQITGYAHGGYLKAEVVPAVDSSNDKIKEEDDDMKYYKTLNDVPESYRPTIRKMMEKGALKGRSDPDPNSLEDNVLDVSEDYCRVMTTLDRMGKLD